ncbi:MAG: D-alanyl-D-alanine carboxypeptidase/D-alanyl-D-alanine-endopeptidase [Ramlibacter sp.]|nr:D-alanyl-D-alanine carboxypeptidase/D-alanyl-D-alanine-endopeptidase [Ramlibacter sp.]
MRLTHCLAAALAILATAPVQAKGLPPGVEAALARAKIPADAVTLLVADADGKAPPRLSHRTEVAFNPASVMKLVTTYAALDQLGPAFAWHTPVYVDGPVRDGVLTGNLYVRGQGDPTLVVERLWLLLRRVQGLGIRQIAGDIVLDHGAFDVAPQDPGRFDGEPLRPYNAAPDALLLNYKSVVMTFVPDRGNASAAVHVEPPLSGVQFPPSVATAPGECADWRGALKADFANPSRVRFAGAYPAACGERVWPLAFADPASYAARAVAGLWTQLGGTLTGQVRDGRVPVGLAPAFEAVSPPLAEVVRDINKYSNNVMAQQLYLTLSLQQKGLGTLAGSQEVLAQWWRERLGGAEPPVMDNGSGLSRDARITARSLGRLLQRAWASPLMPELVSSLPISGVDGTLRRSKSAATAHLKTGSLRDVAGVAGYVLGASGKRHVLVALVNHPNAAQARPVFDALVDWAASDL